MTRIRIVNIASVIPVLAVACIQSSTVTCPDGSTCPNDKRCSLYVDSQEAERYACVTDAQLEACADEADQTPCSAPGSEIGACFGGGCLPSFCGNLRVDPQERCDDGNVVTGDGCSQNCSSTERCRDGFADPEIRDIDGNVLVAAEQCDDGNASNQDGCTSACRIEVPTWFDEQVLPSARRGQAIAFVDRFGVIMFAGASFIGDTWRWNGTKWIPVALVGPPQRNEHAMAYDASRDQLVVYGGTQINNPPTNDTWIFQRGAWSPGPPGPAIRTEHAMAYHAGRKTVVMFGGGVGQVDATGETWEWNGTGWSVLAISGPPARRDHAMAYDPVRDEIVLFGGRDGALLSDTWIYDGQTWRAGPSGPPARRGHAMAFDPISGRVVLTGGRVVDQAPVADSDEVWEWDGTSWTLHPTRLPRAISQHATATDGTRGLVLTQQFGSLFETFVRRGTAWDSIVPTVPPDRSHPAAALDTRRRQVLMFGGLLLGSSRQDTWIWDGNWTESSAAPRPPVRHSAGLAYDATNDHFILFGGLDVANFTNPLGDTWMWDPHVQSWQQLAPATSPSGRAGHALVHDPSQGRIVLFGGSSALQNDLQDMWSWDGTTWSIEPEPPIAFRDRANMGAAYDPQRRTIIVFGGENTFGIQGDLWEWNGSTKTWRQYHPALAPIARTGTSLAWDAGRQRMVMFAGSTSSFAVGAGIASSDAWELVWSGDEPSWFPVPATNPPPPRAFHALVPDIAGTGVTRIGGSTPNNPSSVIETLRWNGPGFELCVPNIDDDGDGLAGCDDPDCWALCTPTCVPGAPTSDCDPTVGCADATCSGLERCETCAGDCGACATTCGDFECNGGETIESCPGDCTP